MRFFTIEYLSYSLTLVGSESSNIHQRSDLLFFRAGDDSAGVSVPSQQNWAIDSLENAIECGDIVG